MRTLQEHIDDLDRMVDSSTAVAKVRSQIAFIGREVAALEADYARLAEAHTKLQEAHSQSDGIHTKAVADLQAKHRQEIARLTAGPQRFIPDRGFGANDLRDL